MLVNSFTSKGLLGQHKMKGIILEYNRDLLSENTAKTTVGITALSSFRDHIEKKVCDLDVGLGLLLGAAA